MDDIGASKALRKKIDEKYEFEAVVGKGSYGCVFKGVCKQTCREVALKIMVNQTDTEYDAIKVLREISLLKKLNNLTQELV